MLKDLVKGVCHLGIPVCDLEQAAKWYEEKLGFVRVHEKSVYYPVRLDLLFLQLENLMIALYKPAAHLLSQIAERRAGVIDHFAIDAADFTNCAQTVYKKGAVLDASTPDGCVFYEHLGEKGVRGINFTGPSNEVVELCHDYNQCYGEQKGLGGWSHLAIKVANLKDTMTFYKKLGFEQVMEGYLDTPTGRLQIGFVNNHGFVLELIQVTRAELPELKKLGAGRLDHIALYVSDVREAYYLCKKEGISVVEPTICELPLFEHGVSYFTILGPDGERIQLNERKTW